MDLYSGVMGITWEFYVKDRELNLYREHIYLFNPSLDPDSMYEDIKNVVDSLVDRIDKVPLENLPLYIKGGNSFLEFLAKKRLEGL